MRRAAPFGGLTWLRRSLHGQLLALLVAAGCGRPPQPATEAEPSATAPLSAAARDPAPAPARDPGRDPAQQATLPGVYIDVPGATPESPWVVGLHGRGDSAAGFAGVPRQWAGKLNWRLLQAPLPWPADAPRGFQWFTLRDPGVSAEQKAAERAAAVELVQAHIRSLKLDNRKIVLFGFSQGCFLAAWYASQHPADVDAVLCFGGGLPASDIAALPAGQRSPQIHFVHGEADRVIEPRWSEEASQLLQDKGFAVTRSLFAGGHTLPAQLRPQLQHWLTGVLGTEVAFVPSGRMLGRQASAAAVVERSP